MKDIKESTMNVYVSTIKSFSKKLGYETVPENTKWLNNFDLVMNEINSIQSLHTRKNKLNAIIIFYQTFGTKKDIPIMEKYTNEIDKLSEELDALVSTNKKTEKQEKNWMTKEELLEVAEKLKKNIPDVIDTYKDYRKLILYIILQSHILMPLRNDFADCKIYWAVDWSKKIEDTDTNYIIINKSKNTGILILNRYKTVDAKEGGRKVINLPVELVMIYKKYINDILKFSDGQHWLFVDKDTNKLTRNAYTKIFQSIFKDTGKKISSSMLRHIIISETIPIDENELKKRKELSYLMGHSVEMQMEYAKI